MPIPAVLLDLDGTLIDTNYLHTIAWSRALADAGEWAPMNAIHRLVGMGSGQLVERLLDRPCPKAEEARAERFGELAPEVRAFPGAADLLSALKGLGVAVVLATSSPKDELDRALDVLDVRDDLDAITSADDVDNAKPSPDIFDAALRSVGADRRYAIVVGDSVWDIEAASAAGLPTIGVETGGFSHHELSEAGAIRVYRDVEAMLGQLPTSPITELVLAARVGS